MRPMRRWELGWRKPYFCDADHIYFDTVDGFIDACDFYHHRRRGLDRQAGGSRQFVEKHPELLGELKIPGIEHHLHTTKEFVRRGRVEIFDGGERGGPDLSQDRSREGRGDVRHRSFDG